MVAAKSVTLPLIRTASILGIIQGLGWAILSVAALIVWYSDLDIILDEDVTLISQILYLIYFNSSEQLNDVFIIASKQIIIFFYLYLVLSFGWLIASSCLQWAIQTKKSIRYHIIAWLLFAGLSSVLDLILTCLLSHDYHKAESSYIVASCVGIVMTLAARGFVLWLVNIIFIVILTKYLWKQQSSIQRPVRQPPFQRNLPYIDAYSNYDNAGYQSEPYSKSHQFNDYQRPPSSNNGINRSMPRPHVEPSNPYGMRTAQIRKPARNNAGQRSPPLAVNSPHIPDPDYSPPGSPRVRGVLRPKSNYMY